MSKKAKKKCNSNRKSSNPAKYIVTEEQKKSIYSLKNINDGMLYTMDYSSDYKLDKILKLNIKSVDDMISFVKTELICGGEQSSGIIDMGCSAFSVKTADEDILVGRNFDYKMKMTAVLIRTKPEDGYSSIGIADAGWMNYDIGSLDDGKTDISMAISFPYLVMDGMNEKGLSISILKLDGEPTQQETGKNKIMTTTALRLVLDKAATVKEAIEILKNYDMYSAMPNANFHFLISDASGYSVVLEYAINEISILEENYVTNFYLTPYMKGLGHGKDRYDILKSTIDFKKNILSKKQAMSLLEMVSQKETEEYTSKTQWSVVYDLTNLKATVAIRGDYEKLFKFKIDNISRCK